MITDGTCAIMEDNHSVFVCPVPIACSGEGQYIRKSEYFKYYSIIKDLRNSHNLTVVLAELGIYLCARHTIRVTVDQL